MPERSSKKKATKKRKEESEEPDVNQLAAAIVQAATRKTKTGRLPVKNPAAVALGRLGGKKGGPARSKKLRRKKSE